MRRGKRPITMGTANEARRMEPNVTEQEMRLGKATIFSFPDSTQWQETKIQQCLERTMYPAKDGKTRCVGKERLRFHTSRVKIRPANFTISFEWGGQAS